MIDIQIIRDNPEKVRAGILKKHLDPAILEELIKVDKKRRKLRMDTENNQAEQNKNSEEMAKFATANLWGAADELKKMQTTKETLRARLKALSDKIKTQREELAVLDEQYITLMRQIPNLPADDVPEGETDKENVIVRTEGKKRKFDFTPKDHEKLGLALDLYDVERATKVAGSKFYYLKNELVILEQAVLRFMLDALRAKGFTIMTVPVMAKAECMYGAGHFATPEDATEGDAYTLERDNLYLTGTAEVSLANYHANEIIEEKDLTLRYAGISTCFRRESGTYGKETRGLYRVHQFQKVEMFSYTRPEDSEKEHAFLLSIAEDLLQKLGLCYQVVLNCGGDLGLPQYKKWDIETWMPGMDKFGETHSCSNDTDYQARSLGIRMRRSKSKEIEFLHTLNNTGFASPRILIPILENGQQKDGSIEIPEVLIPYTGFSHIRKGD